MAELHPQIARDSVPVGRFPLCRLRLMLDANYPWTILVPDREGVTEIYQLEAADQRQLLHESSALSQVLVDVFGADKLNIAALGNLVPQLHVHHVVRYRSDAAWPAPVWGSVPPKPYQEEELAARVRQLEEALATVVGFRSEVAG